MSRVAIFGATGFIGATLVERLLASPGHEPKALIHSTGNAWRLARHAIPLHPVDVLDRAQVRRAIDGCTHVVNCSLGGTEVMFRGLDHLLAASAEARVRFVHLSSIALYGEQPAGETLDESAVPRPAKGSYGWVKQQQDDRVAAAARRGLEAVVLCPTHIFGAYSVFLVACIRALAAGRFALVDGGKLPASYNDVSNLCQAIERALDCREADGQRVIIEDGQGLAWSDVAAALAPLAEREPPFASLEREDARAIAEAGTVPPRLGAALRHLAAHFVSPEFKHVLKTDPFLLKRAESALGLVRALPAALSRRILGGAAPAPAPESPAAAALAAYDAWPVRAQFLSVRWNTERARRVLGYVPERSFGDSMSALAAWYRATHGFGSPEWPLLREL